MSKIEQLDPTYDLWLSYSWSTNDHGVCGHTYEVIEYYYILKEHFKVGIFFAEQIELDLSKYDFTEEEIEELHSNIVYGDKPSILRGTNILFVDGGVVNNHNKTLLFDNILYFACGNKQVKDNVQDNVYILQDDRVYDPVIVNGINYKKKILFSKFKRLFHPNLRNVLMYGTKNCRNVSLDIYKKFSKKYRTSTVYAITSEENKHENFDNVEFLVPPVIDLFSKFQLYIYTPIDRKWDCSPRFIAECKFYNKDVIYYKIDYWEEDKGLYWRKWDIDNDFDSLYLTEDDEIVPILQKII